MLNTKHHNPHIKSNRAVWFESSDASISTQTNPHSSSRAIKRKPSLRDVKSQEVNPQSVCVRFAFIFLEFLSQAHICSLRSPPDVPLSTSIAKRDKPRVSLQCSSLEPPSPSPPLLRPGAHFQILFLTMAFTLQCLDSNGARKL